MRREYFTVVLRSLTRHKLYSFINVAGLALGLASVILIILFIRYEISYDTWVPQTSRLYRIEVSAMLPGRRAVYDTALTPYPLAKAMQAGVPGVIAATRLKPTRLSLWVGRRRFFETVDVVDPNFLRMIRLPLLMGDRARALAQPESVVLSEATARKLFGLASPLGRTVALRWRQCAAGMADCRNVAVALTVTGVMRNVPRDSQLSGDAIVPDTSVLGGWRDDPHWLSASCYTYVSLAPGVSPGSVLARFRPINDRDAAPALARRHLAGPASRLFQLHLTPFVAVHLNSAKYVQNMTPAGSWVTVYGVAVIGTLILLVACFNFMNLSTARASVRAREISLRKCVGASRKELIVQLLCESVALALCALIFALALVEAALPAFDRVLGWPIALHYLGDWRTSLVILAVVVGAGLLSGIYPALILSGFRPGAVLRAGGSGQAGSGRLRSALVVLQAAVSIGLAIAAIVVSRQVSFARRLALGFDPSHVVVMHTGDSPGTRGFIAAVEKYPGVAGVARSSRVPFSSGHPMFLARIPGQPGAITVAKVDSGPNFPRVYAIPLVAGRLLAADRAQDTLSNHITPRNAGHNILINVAAARRFGYTPRQAIGRTIVLNDSPVRIVGVLGNMKFFGALMPVRPTVYFNDPHHMSRLSIRIRGRNEAATLAFIRRTWRAFSPLYQSRRYFLSTRYAGYYRAYQRQGVMLEVFVGAAIAVAGLGLFGLTVFTAERRTKEVGIRKISGARTRDVLALMLWEISVPVLLANGLAWPVAYVYLRRWLQGFANHIGLDPLYFLVSGAAALVIAWAMVFSHALRVARTSPIRALRYE